MNKIPIYLLINDKKNNIQNSIKKYLDTFNIKENIEFRSIYLPELEKISETNETENKSNNIEKKDESNKESANNGKFPILVIGFETIEELEHYPFYLHIKDINNHIGKDLIKYFKIPQELSELKKCIKDIKDDKIEVSEKTRYAEIAYYKKTPRIKELRDAINKLTINKLNSSNDDFNKVPKSSIIIVDNNNEDLEEIENLLKSTGYENIFSSEEYLNKQNSDEFYNKCKRSVLEKVKDYSFSVELNEKNIIDYIIIDINLKGKHFTKEPSDTSGIELLKEIRKINLTIPIIMLSKYEYPDTIIKCIKAGANYYSLKHNLYNLPEILKYIPESHFENFGKEVKIRYKPIINFNNPDLLNDKKLIYMIRHCFNICRKIDIFPLCDITNASGNTVLRVERYDSNGEKSIPVIVKYGNADNLEQEYEEYLINVKPNSNLMGFSHIIKSVKIDNNMMLVYQLLE